VIQKAATLVGDALETADEAWIGDTATAWMVLHWRSIRGLVTRYVDLQDITGEFEELEDGDVVTLTISGASIEGALGLVSRDYLSPVAQTLRVIILPTV
jgi:transcriptional regulator GlxA family with amidase domain